MACGTFLAKVEQVSSYYLSHVTNLLQQIFASHNKLCVAPQEKHQKGNVALVKVAVEIPFQKKGCVIVTIDLLCCLLFALC